MGLVKDCIVIVEGGVFKICEYEKEYDPCFECDESGTCIDPCIRKEEADGVYDD